MKPLAHDEYEHFIASRFAFIIISFSIAYVGEKLLDIYRTSHYSEIPKLKFLAISMTLISTTLAILLNFYLILGNLFFMWLLSNLISLKTNIAEREKVLLEENAIY